MPGYDKTDMAGLACSSCHSCILRPQVFTQVDREGRPACEGVFCARCHNAEAEITQHLPSLVGGNNSVASLALANYYFYDQGASFEAVAGAAVGVDIAGLLGKINSTRDSIIQVTSHSFSS